MKRKKAKYRLDVKRRAEPRPTATLRGRIWWLDEPRELYPGWRVRLLGVGTDAPAALIRSVLYGEDDSPVQDARSAVRDDYGALTA